MLMRLPILGLLALASASPAEKRTNFVTVMTGQYSVVNCGRNTTLIINLLDKLYASLLPVIEDAKSPNTSPAYKAFFKDPSYAPFVSALFTNVTTGVPLTPPAPYSLNGGVSFLCVTAPEQFVYTNNGRRDAYNDCVANPLTPSSYIGFDPPKQYVILCPSFFTTNLVSVPPRGTCLTVETYINRFRGNGQSFWAYKMWLLLAMITHYYLYTSTRLLSITNTADVNKCFRLEAEQSSLNANNYVFYAASIFGHCSDFPNPPSSGRELLEVDIGDPSDNGPDVVSLDGVTFIATDLELGVGNITGTP